MREDIENAMLQPSVDYEIKSGESRFDVSKDDIIQVTNPKNKHIGKIGKIVKVSHAALIRNPYCVIEFANDKSAMMRASSFKVVCKAAAYKKEQASDNAPDKQLDAEDPADAPDVKSDKQPDFKDV